MAANKVLVDTNILIYAWDKSDPAKQMKAIQVLEQFGSQIVISVQNLSEFTSVMLRHGCDLGWLEDAVNRYERVMIILPLGQSEVAEAIRAVSQYNMSFWDAQIWAVARLNGVNTIFTEDGPTGQTIDGVTYVNPLV